MIEQEILLNYFENKNVIFIILGKSIKRDLIFLQILLY